MPRGFRVEGTDMRVVAAELRAAGKEVRKATRKALVESVKPIVPTVREAALNIPVKGTGEGEVSSATLHRAESVRAKTFGAAIRHSSLRQVLAAAVRSDVRIRARGVTVSLRVDGNRLPQDQRSLPHYMDGDFKRWRHPVFGHDVWVDQQAHPWFRVTVERFAPAVRKRVERVLGEVARKAHFH